MSSNDGFGRPIDDPSSDDRSPTVHVQWPYMDPVAQGRIERKFFEEGATIHFDKIPQLQFWAPFLFFRDIARVLFVTKRVVHHAVGAKRPLTATEVDATSEHAAASIRYLAYAQPVSLALAAVLTWRGSATFRFPFYQPKMRWFHPFYFPNKMRPFIQGPAAVRVWHVARFITYCPLTWFGCFFFFSSMSETTFHARVLRDPRLTALLQDLNRNNKALGELERREQRRRMGLPEQPGARVPQQNRGIAQYPSGQDTSEVNSQASQDNLPPAWQPDDRQPADTLERPGIEREAPSAPQSSWARRAPPQTPPSTPPGARDSDPWSRNADDDSDLFDDDDDASPVSRSARRAETRRSGSTWERLRQQAQPGVAQWEQGDSSSQGRGWAQIRQDKAQNTKEASQKTESFAYSKQDEEREQRNYEKDKAQKEFDALLDSERRGGGDGGWSRS
ncbi:hypothetical protein F5B20DRAFT_427380 [Whalleya microplaca]|nr:hypothetical protein F5B20DRAFT_427380 [Whalleya microplaca]